jgi:hypothetical protein
MAATSTTENAAMLRLAASLVSVIQGGNVMGGNVGSAIVGP